MNPKPNPNQGAPPRYKRTLKVLHAVVRQKFPSYHPHHRHYCGCALRHLRCPWSIVHLITVAKLTRCAVLAATPNPNPNPNPYPNPNQVRGCWLLPPEWLLASLDCGRFLPEV